jgi:hypothetical protein
VNKVIVTEFIDLKRRQLAYYVRAFWSRRINYSELELYFWDTLEEWSIVKLRPNEPYTEKERVFWHLLHQLHYWPEHTLLHDQCLRGELMNCVECLEGTAAFPLDCVGVRP